MMPAERRGTPEEECRDLLLQQDGENALDEAVEHTKEVANVCRSKLKPVFDGL